VFSSLRRDQETKDPDGKFKPNTLNTVVYLMSTTMTITTFLSNYRVRQSHALRAYVFAI